VQNRCVRGLQLDTEFANQQLAQQNRRALNDPFALIDEQARALFDTGQTPITSGHNDVDNVRKSMSRATLLNAAASKLFVVPSTCPLQPALLTRLICLPVPLMDDGSAMLLPTFLAFNNASEQYFDVFVAPPMNVPEYVNTTAWAPTKCERRAQFLAKMVDLFLTSSTRHVSANLAAVDNILDNSVFEGACPVAAKVGNCPKGSTLSIVSVLRHHPTLPRVLKFIASCSGAGAHVDNIPLAIDQALAVMSPFMELVLGFTSYAKHEMSSWGQPEQRCAAVTAAHMLTQQTFQRNEQARLLAAERTEQKMIAQQRALEDMFAWDTTSAITFKEVSQPAIAAQHAAQDAAGVAQALEAIGKML
jgi:hypothetical protein